MKIKTAEEILREEVLKVTKGKDYTHNVTHDGIIQAMKNYAHQFIELSAKVGFRYNEDADMISNKEDILNLKKLLK